MTATTDSQSRSTNMEILRREFARVRRYLERHASGAGAPSSSSDEARANSGTIETLRTIFDLTPFEADVLLLCAGVELDADIARLCGPGGGDPRRPQATFSLALAAHPSGHWSAIVPSSPLRRWRLIDLHREDEPLVGTPLRLDERILHFIVGTPAIDAMLEPILQPVTRGTLLPESHALIARSVAQLWQSQTRGAKGAVVLRGSDDATARAISAHVCDQLGIALNSMCATDLPPHADARDELLRRWERESALLNSALFVALHNDATQDHRRALAAWLDRLQGLVVVGGPGTIEGDLRGLVAFDVPRPTRDEQAALWSRELKINIPVVSQMHAVTAQFDLTATQIHTVAAAVNRMWTPTPEIVAPPMDTVWNACRAELRGGLDALAQHLQPNASYADLAVPDVIRHSLSEIIVSVRQRSRVFHEWGVAERLSRGQGITALFAGPSGTGKTLAAEVLAHELRLDLYRVDLSSVVSKWIGETEKNLRRIFDAADGGGAVLLFDEADALFGKRSEVRDSHDRYANLEISYLLQRMEMYRGLAILTTNMRQAIDPAMLRRLRFVIEFPFPEASQRSEIWKRMFPARVPTAGLDFAKLAQLNIAGGNIRNISLNAAFLAADDGGRVQMTHVLQAARSEYAKLERTLTDAEIKGWIALGDRPML